MPFTSSLLCQRFNNQFARQEQTCPDTQQSAGQASLDGQLMSTMRSRPGGELSINLHSSIYGIEFLGNGKYKIGVSYPPICDFSSSQVDSLNCPHCSQRAMASKYAKPMQIPVDFPDVLRNFTREVLRQQGKVETKEAIYAFGSQYFKELAAKQGGANKAADEAAMSALTPTYIKMEEEAVKEVLVVAFNDAQQQDGGMVVYEQFKQVLLITSCPNEANISEGRIVSWLDTDTRRSWRAVAALCY